MATFAVPPEHAGERRSPPGKSCASCGRARVATVKLIPVEKEILGSSLRQIITVATREGDSCHSLAVAELLEQSPRYIFWQVLTAAKTQWSDSLAHQTTRRSATSWTFDLTLRSGRKDDSEPCQPPSLGTLFMQMGMLP